MVAEIQPLTEIIHSYKFITMNEASTRERLITHGLALAGEKGLRGLGVREVAKAAGVNPGSFVYHFGTREAFIREVVERWYAPMYDRLKQVSEDPSETRAMERLRATICELLDAIAGNARFMAHLVADAVAGEPAARAFLLTVPGRHPELLFQLVQQAQAEGDLVPGPPLVLLSFLMSSVVLPMTLAVGPLAHQDWLPEQAGSLIRVMADPATARQRLSWALQGISTPRGTL